MATSTKTKKQTATVKTKKTVKKTQPKSDSLSKQQKAIIAQQKKRDVELFKTPLKENEALVSYRMVLNEVSHAVSNYSTINYKNLHTNEYYMVRNTNFLAYLFPFLRNHIWQTAYVISEEELLRVIEKKPKAQGWAIWDGITYFPKDTTVSGVWNSEEEFDEQMEATRSPKAQKTKLGKFLVRLSYFGTPIGVALGEYEFALLNPYFSLLPAKDDVFFTQIVATLLSVSAIFLAAMISFLLVNIYVPRSPWSKMLDITHKKKIKVKGEISGRPNLIYVYLIPPIIMILFLSGSAPNYSGPADVATRGGGYSYDFDVTFIIAISFIFVSNALAFPANPKYGNFVKIERKSIGKTTFPSFVLKIKEKKGIKK